MPHLETVKAWIEVDGVALEEFKVEVDEVRRTVHCYVASEVGKEFMVHWSWQGDWDTSGRLTVDGRKALLARSGRRKNQHATITKINLPEDPQLMGRLKFGDILLTDDESISLQDEHLVKALGSIELVVSTGILRPNDRSAKSANPNTADMALAPQQPIYERMKKAGSHQVVFGEVSHARSCPLSSRKTRDNPCASYFYTAPEVLRALLSPSVSDSMYKAILLAQEIIIPPSSPIPGPATPLQETSPNRIVAKQEDRDPDNDDEDEDYLRALEEQAAAIEARAAAVKERLKKRKSEGLSERRLSKRMKVEEIDARATFRSGEIIDLCND